MEAGVTVAVVVYAAAGEVVVCVTTRVMGSVRVVLGVAIRVRVAPRSLEDMAGLREVVWTVGALGVRGSEKVTVLWLDGNAAPLLTVRAAGRGSLFTLSEWVGMAVRGALAVETVPVP